MRIAWTSVQKQKLIELGADVALLEQTFENPEVRNSAYQKAEYQLITLNKRNLQDLRNNRFRSLACQLETLLVDRLNQEGFVQVVTPIILSKSMLNKMTITPEHPLTKQVFWLSENKCLRPMLAPNLYYLLRDLERLWEKPVRIFEVGPCFRKESQGIYHLNEFTMLNLVELGTPVGQQKIRLRELAAIVMDIIGIENYDLITSDSEVYGETLDVMVEELELGSGAFGPHSLDEQWGIFDPWVGIGFGLERLAMVKEGHRNIRRVGRSLSYLDGSRLNI
ncbi:MAG: pyrrolysine--tRNA(Pyl) ligase large subunit [Desulfitobacterium hafniense]|nr:pyrrolysine--tRNA(Pyl) ligase large subunit [Desulfitobacterium hafniense]